MIDEGWEQRARVEEGMEEGVEAEEMFEGFPGDADDLLLHHIP
jgi:hypothetical protein